MAILIRSLEPALSVNKGHVSQLSLTVRGKWVTSSGLELNQSEWMNLSSEERADLVSLINKGFASVTVDGVALTAAQVEGNFVTFDPAITTDWDSTPAVVKDALDELADRMRAVEGYT